ncbi:MAG: hypothetical protein ACR2PB_08985 [Desulfocapsaceae bacterium]
MNLPGRFRNALSIAIIASLYVLISPVTGQSQSETADPDKLAADQAACQQHAMAFSGYNPDTPAQPAASSSPRQPRAGLRGAARGAAKGAVAGGTLERFGDEDKHDDATEVGAAVGAVAGGARARRNAKQQAPPPAPAPEGDPALYSTSYNDCMTSRGYPTQ